MFSFQKSDQIDPFELISQKSGQIDPFQLIFQI